MKIQIEIDCEPFAPRPDVYFSHIWKNILESTEKLPEAVSKFFGCWRWENIEVPESKEEEIRDYLTGLFNKGKIRYASW